MDNGLQPLCFTRNRLDVLMKMDLSTEWRDAGVAEGDVLLVHSSIKGTLQRYQERGVRLSPSDILTSFLDAVGPSGTVVLPLFNFDFTRGVAFDLRSTPSHMGALTEAGRCHPSAVRTGHPIYSFAAIGSVSQKFRLVDNFSGYGSDSPFALLRTLNAKIAVLDLPDQNSMTFYHHVEEMHQVEYRYHKRFSGEYIDLDGQRAEKTYGLFVRNIEKGVLTHVNPTGELMWKNGLWRGDRPGERSGLRTISANQMFDFVSSIIQAGNAKDLLYRVEGEELV